MLNGGAALKKLAKAIHAVAVDGEYRGGDFGIAPIKGSFELCPNLADGRFVGSSIGRFPGEGKSQRNKKSDGGEKRSTHRALKQTSEWGKSNAQSFAEEKSKNANSV
jgi:hypothetical protein